MNEEKAWTFLFYTAYRDARSSEERWEFDPDDFNQVKARHAPGNGSARSFYEDPNRSYTGSSVFKQVRASLSELLIEQRADHRNTPHLYSKLCAPSALRDHMEIKALATLVGQRKKQVMYAQHKDRASDRVDAFTNIKWVKPLELAHWNYNANTNSKQQCFLKHRGCMYHKWTLCACSRGEALDKADLCDFFLVQDCAPVGMTSPLFIATLMIHLGKTNRKKEDCIVSRTMRHVEVEHCAIGALAFYLLARFWLTKEDEYFDFRDNASWDSVKLMIGQTARHQWQTNRKAVGQRQFFDSFNDRVSEVEGMPRPRHSVHFGRIVMPPKLERT